MIEMLIVVALISTAAVFIYQAVRYRQQSQAADSYITLQAREMAEFARAVQSFAADNKASWTVNARQTITPAQLISANKLTNTWAQRGGTAGVTPIGETYRAFAIKDNTGVVRIVTADFGRNPTDSLVRKTGYQSTATSLQGYKARVADQMTRDFKGYAGYVSAGSMSARGPSGTFTQDLTAYLGGDAPALPVAIELVDWPEYRRPGQEEESGAGAFCTILDGVAGTLWQNRFGTWVTAPAWSMASSDAATHYREPALPAGARNVMRIPICSDGLNIISTGVPGVGLSTGTTTDVYTVQVGECIDSRGVLHDPQAVRITETRQTFSLNAVSPFSIICHQQAAVRNPHTCAISIQSSMTDAHRVRQTQPVSFPTANGTQTFNPLSSHPSNNRSTGNASTRGHWFYCTDTAP